MSEHERASKRAPAADALSTAIDAAEREPQNGSHWDLVEEIVDTAQRPSDVRELFRSVLAKKKLDAATATQVGQRAVRFYEAWYAEDTRELSELLTRVLEIDKRAQWAFERLTVALTVAERWDELLAAYDRAIGNADETARRMKLLDEAAQTAKDFAGKPDRAIDYLQKLFALDPDNASLAASLERLLERQGRYRDLIELWGSRIEMQPQKQQRDTRLRMATCHLDSLHEHATALTEIERVLKDAPEYKPVFDLLERLLATETAEPAVRKTALAHLKDRFIKLQKPRDVVRVLELGLAFVSQDDRRALLRELIERWLDLHEDARAMQHQSLLLVLEPMPKERDALRQLAERTRDFERQATALGEAALACAEPGTRADLLLEAARVREEQLAQVDRAIELYRQVFDASVSTDITVQAGRKLAALLEEQKRERETLDVLSRLCELESDGAVRKSMLGRVAALAEKLGDSSRAAQAWQLRVGDDANDVEALGALIDAANRSNDDALLVKLLQKRIAAPLAAHERRSDLVRLAKLYDEKIKDLSLAIDTWRQVTLAYGEDREAVTALTDLLSRAERWAELAEVLQHAAAREIDRFTELQSQLGDAYRQRLDKPLEAVMRYRSALQVDPAHARARAGANALLDDDKCRAIAADSLAEAYTQTDDFQALLDLLEVRIATADSPAGRAELLVEAALLHEERKQDQKAALSCYRRAFALLPDDRATEREIRRLAEALGQWNAVVTAYRDTISMLPRSSPRVAELRYQEGLTLEERLKDREGALVAYLEAALLMPERLELGSAAARLAASLGRWDAAALQVVSCATANAALLPSLLTTLEAAAREGKSWDKLCDALTRAASFDADAFIPSVARDLHMRVAMLQRDERNDLAEAENALSRAVQADPTHKPALMQLAEVQRRAPSVALLSTLERLADVDPENLDVLVEAAEVALDHTTERDRARSALETLYDRALGLWRRGRAPAGERDAQTGVAWAIERLCALHAEAGNPRAALDLLVVGSALPFEAEAVQGLRHEAAELARGQLGDAKRAIELYRDILAVDARDTQALNALAELYTQTDRLPELLSLRRHELSLGVSQERKLALRLDVARVLGELDARGDRVASLRENLSDEPGHKASLAALSELLRASGKYVDLAALLQAQARALREQGRLVEAAALYRELAVLDEHQLSDKQAALAAYRELHALEPNGDASQALARLHSSLGDHASAAEWLEVRLGTAPPDTRAITAIELARAHMEAGQLARARGCLEQALVTDPTMHDARDLLAELYRGEGAHELLARLLAEGAELVGSAERRIAYLREAAHLYYDALGTPERAIPVLSRAVQLVTDDTRLRMMLAEGLRIAGRFDEAEVQLRALIESFGRRRSPERAEVHYQLARIAESAGAIEEAFTELELATKMDLAHQGAMHMLARLARDQGDLERAERAYRGLLLVVRRQKSDDPAQLGASEVFFELYRISQQRSQPEQGDELLASALEGATQSDVEARRFARVLRARGEHALLLRVLDARLSLTREPEVEAEILAAKADIFEQDQGKLTEALELRLQALALLPESDALHAAARALAVRAGELSRYLDALGQAIDAAQRERAADSGKRVALLTLRMGRVIEEELEDFDRAAGLYSKVEASGEHVTEAWLALARVAGARGDKGEERRVLARIAGESGGAHTDKAARDQARFLLAELELSEAEWRDAGAATLAAALEQTPDYARAKVSLTKAIAQAPEHAGVLALFERVARISRDDIMLIDFIERRAARADATLDDTREGIDLALRIGEMKRAEAMLTRAAELARKHKAQHATWVFSGLAECRLQAGDVKAGIAHLREALDFASESEVDSLLRELAQLASGKGGDLQVAADTYARLLEREPSDRTLWEPMLAVLTQQKDRKKLDAFVTRTLEVVLPVEDRVFVLLAQAKFLAEVLRKEKDAVPVLKRVLEEDATQLEATDRLLAIYQRQGMNVELANLLRNSFDRARDERNVEIITELGLRLGQLYGAEHAIEACDSYRSALEWNPGHAGLIKALLARMPDDSDASERAALQLRLLESESGPAAATLAMEVADSYAKLGDDSSAQRALELGYRASPENEALRDRLENFYAERELWAALASMMVAEAERVGLEGGAGSRVAVARFKNAAMLYRDKLGDVDGASSALRAALKIVPEDLTLLAELARNLAAAGQHDTAIADVTRLLDDHPAADSGRVDLLRVRADLFASVRRVAEAAEDLEAAHAISPTEVATSLAEVLDALRVDAHARNELDIERSASMRLCSVLRSTGQADRARDVLAMWAARDPSDVENLRELRSIDTAAERYDSVIETCLLAIDAEQGEARVETALALADACDKLGKASAALPALLRVHDAIPQSLPLRARLRTLFAALDMKRELATLLLGDAAFLKEPTARVTALLDAARLYLEGDDAEAAIGPLTTAIELAPEDDRTRVLLVDVQLRLGRVEEATAVVDQALNAHKKRRSPELALFQVRMGRICALRGDRPTQLKWLNTALDTDRKSGEVASELANVAIEVEDYDTAMKALRTLTMMEDPHPITRALAFLKQAQIAVVRGDTQRAQHWARKAKSLDENLAEVDTFLAQIGG